MLLFGTAGIPRSTPRGDTITGIERVKELGLDAMELEFVRGVNLAPPMARMIKKAKEHLKVELTCHAPFYINLNSDELHKYNASIRRIMESARIADLAGAQSVTFHAGFYQGKDPKKVYNKIKKAISQMTKQLIKEKANIILKPEVTGKPSQFGSLDELLNLAKEIKNLGFCLDISHMHARSAGKYNTLKEFNSVWNKIKRKLGKSALDNMHIHLSGIKYTGKGEREHLNLKQSDFNYKAFIKSLKQHKVNGIIICESPNLEGDALLLKKEYYKK